MWSGVRVWVRVRLSSLSNTLAVNDTVNAVQHHNNGKKGKRNDVPVIQHRC